MLTSWLGIMPERFSTSRAHILMHISDLTAVCVCIRGECTLTNSMGALTCETFCHSDVLSAILLFRSSTSTAGATVTSIPPGLKTDHVELVSVGSATIAFRTRRLTSDLMYASSWSGSCRCAAARCAFRAANQERWAPRLAFAAGWAFRALPAKPRFCQ